MTTLRPVLYEDANGGARLTLAGGDDRTRAVFIEHGWDGNGYDWGAVAQALALMKMPGRFGLLDFQPEGDYLCVLGPAKAILEELAGWLRAASEDPRLLADAVRYAEGHGLDGCTHR